MVKIVIHISGNSKKYFSIPKNNSEAYSVPSFGGLPTRAGAEVFVGVKFLFFYTYKKFTGEQIL